MHLPHAPTFVAAVAHTHTHMIHFTLSALQCNPEIVDKQRSRCSSLPNIRELYSTYKKIIDLSHPSAITLRCSIQS